MLILTAVNITGGGGQDASGLSNYRVEVAIDLGPPIWKGTVSNHVRKAGATQLLRLIADNMERTETVQGGSNGEGNDR